MEEVTFEIELAQLRESLQDLIKTIMELQALLIELKRVTVRIEEKRDFPEFQKDQNGYVRTFIYGVHQFIGKENAKAGLGVWFGRQNHLNVGELIMNPPTAEIAVIQACIRAIELARSAELSTLIINTNSSFICNSITKLIAKSAGERMRAAEECPAINNRELLRLFELVKTMKHVQWNYIKNGEGIKAARVLAEQGMAQ